jgi:hypothetical protein
VAAAHLWRVETLGRQAQALHKDVELSAVHDPAALKHIYEPVQPLSLSLILILAIGSLQQQQQHGQQHGQPGCWGANGWAELNSCVAVCQLLPQVG